jgi:UDP-3-O-[3-hydroxymyristoyl] glucosamine N-acyltransferase
MFEQPVTIRDLAERLGGSVDGDGETVVRGFEALDHAAAGELTFAQDDRHLGRLTGSKASAAIVPASATRPADCDMPFIVVKDVNRAVQALLGQLAAPEDRPPVGIDPSAVIDESAEIAPSAAIGPQVVVAAGARIGADSTLCAGVRIGSNVTIADGCMLAEGVVVRHGCRIGQRVRIGPNSVIGYDGYGYFYADGVHHKIPHAGNVVIEDDVELGACVCVDRAKWGSTLVGRGSKVDNLVQIAHNVQTGQACLLVAQVGVAGSARLGNGVVIGGQSGVRDNITVGDGVQLAAHSALAQSIEAGKVMAGTPADEARALLRQMQALKKLPDLLKRVKKLESHIPNQESS